MHRRPSRLIIPQYSPPADLSVVAAAELLGESRRAIAAQIVDFAVRKVITIARDPGSGRRSGFTLTYAGADAGGPDEHAVLVTIFSGTPPVGTSIRLAPGRNRALGAALKDPHRWIVARLIDAGLAREKSFWAKVFGRTEPSVPTELASPLVDHLWGLHDYIRLAEKDRLAFLQSPTGAQRTELDVLVLNEKLLPYAVLFGLEKEWMRELDVQYRSLPPEMIASLGDVMLATDMIFSSVELIGDIATLVDAADALDGVGAVFGGIGEFLGGLDFPDFG